MRPSNLLFILLLFTAILPQSVFATLGESETTIGLNQRIFQSTVRNRVVHPSYTVYEMIVDGIVVKEYVSADGMVFAASWRGLTHPNLSLLLGSYFEEYHQASLQGREPQSHAPRVFQTSQMILEKSGHMRDVRGKAYLPGQIPTGVNPKDLE